MSNRTQRWLYGVLLILWAWVSLLWQVKRKA